MKSVKQQLGPDVSQQLGPDVSQHIFFMHALLGCGTTSRVYGIGKGASLNKFKTSAHFCEQAIVFDRPTASTDDVVEAGEKALACLYNGKPAESLNVVRHKRFCQKVASSISHVKPESQQQRNTTAFVSTTRTGSGRGLQLMSYDQMTGVGGKAVKDLCPCRRTCHQLRMSSSR